MGTAEKTHNTLVLVGDCVALATAVYLAWRVFNMGDGSKLIKMRIVRASSKFAKTQADFWSTVAANADTKYIQIANVTS
jgi:hypothetical protein